MYDNKRVFDNDELALKLSANGKKRAAVTHDTEKNADDLVAVYNDILQKVR